MYIITFVCSSDLHGVIATGGHDTGSSKMPKIVCGPLFPGSFLDRYRRTAAERIARTRGFFFLAKSNFSPLKLY